MVCATCILGLAAGAGSALLAASETLLFRPAKISDIDSVIVVGGLAIDSSLGDPIEWWSKAGAVRHLAQVRPGDASVQLGDGDPQWLRVAEVSWQFFPLVGMPIAAGRDFSPEDERSVERPIIITRRLHRSGITGRSLNLGDTLRLADRPARIVGMVEDDFDYPYATAIWVVRDSSALVANSSIDTTAGADNLPPIRGPRGQFIARLAPRASEAQLLEELTFLLARANEELTPNTGISYGDTIATLPLKVLLTANASKVLPSLLFGAGLVLAMASLGAGLVLARRRLEKESELVIRHALGASPRHIRVFLAKEAIAVGVLAGALAMPIGILCLWFAHEFYFRTNLSFSIRPSMMLTAGLGSMVVASISASLASVRWRFMPQFLAPIVSAHRSRVRRRSDVRVVGQVVVIIQVAIVFALVCSGLVALRAAKSEARDLWKMDPSEVITASITYSSTRVAPRFVNDLTAEIDRIVSNIVGPGQWTLLDRLPLGDQDRRFLQVRDGSTTKMAEVLGATGAFPVVSGLNVVSGTFLTIDDADGVVISEAVERSLGSGGASVGRSLSIGGVQSAVIGVISDDSADDAGRLYVVPKRPSSGLVTLHLLVRCGQRCTVVGQELFRRLRSFPGIRIPRVEKISSLIADQRRPAVAKSAVASWYAAVGILIAVASVFGIVAYSVARRAREFAIRVACGATPCQVLKTATSGPLLAVLLGVVAGTGLTLAISQTTLSFVFGTPAVGWRLIGATAVMLLTAASVAVLIPALQLVSRAHLLRD